MDCQNCTYSKLDSSDPEVYQSNDDPSDFKILMESDTPLLDKPRKISVTAAKTVKKTKKNKRVLSTLDIIISIFVVTPCVVGCWRGIWQILDIYAVYFPVWESFALGMATHIVLALGQEVFHYVIVEKERKSWAVKIFALFLMKFYIITFNLITNMIWRAGWLIFDQFCHLQVNSSGSAQWEGSSTAIVFTVVCTIILLCLKGLKNTLSPPFSIALDTKDEVFLFSTRYIYKVAYSLTTFITKKTTTPPTNRLGTTEKLISIPSNQMQNILNQPPRPFGIDIMGPPPQQFTPTPITRAATEPPAKSTTINYPQLTQYRNNYYPKNIQDIIGYVTKTRHHDTRKNQFKDNESQQAKATNQEGLKQNFNSSGSFKNADPFYPFKPNDPSEINLLATASFRFAPPAWKSFQKLYQQGSQQPSPPQQHMTPPNGQVEDSTVQETMKNFAKPFVVTLNIFPMEADYYSGSTRYGQKVLSQRVQGDFPYRLQVDPRTKISSKSNKMTIQLNVFPESFVSLPARDREKYAESEVSKVKFV